MSCVLESRLHIAEVLIDLVPQHLPKEADVGTLSAISLNRTDDSRGPIYDQGFQTVALVQVCVHKLLHRFPWLGTFKILFIVFFLLIVNIVNEISALLQGKLFIGQVLLRWCLNCLITNVLVVLVIQS